MTDLVDSEEAAALASAVRADDARGSGPRVSTVTPRDFSEPRTLSADRIAHIHKTLSARLQVIANAMAGPLRGHPTLTLGEVSEVNAQSLFDGFVRPFLVHGFTCAGGQGWVIWDTDAARIACDTVLSRPPTEDELEEDASTREAMLTRTERRVVGALLDEIVERVGAEFGLQVEKGIVCQEPEELTTMEDLGPDSDARRLFVHIAFEPETGHPSDIRVYLPGISAPESKEDLTPRLTAPKHLSSVSMDVSVHVGGTYVPLAELLNIEVGDVIPLDERIGALAELEVEETICGRGRVGTHGGLLAFRVEEISIAPRQLGNDAESNAS